MPAAPTAAGQGARPDVAPALTSPRQSAKPAAGWAGSSAVEHVTFNHVVEGSIPSPLTILSHRGGRRATFAQSEKPPSTMWMAPVV